MNARCAVSIDERDYAARCGTADERAEAVLHVCKRITAELEHEFMEGFRRENVELPYSVDGVVRYQTWEKGFDEVEFEPFCNETRLSLMRAKPEEMADRLERCRRAYAREYAALWADGLAEIEVPAVRS